MAHRMRNKVIALVRFPLNEANTAELEPELELIGTAAGPTWELRTQWRKPDHIPVRWVVPTGLWQGNMHGPFAAWREKHPASYRAQAATRRAACTSTSSGHCTYPNTHVWLILVLHKPPLVRCPLEIIKL